MDQTDEGEVDFDLTSPRDAGSYDEKVDYDGGCDSSPPFAPWPVGGQSQSVTVRVFPRSDPGSCRHFAAS